MSSDKRVQPYRMQKASTRVLVLRIIFLFDRGRQARDGSLRALGINYVVSGQIV